MTDQVLSAAQKSRLEALKSKHMLIDERIEEEQSRPAVADFYLRQLKKQKLILKEQIESLRLAANNGRTSKVG